MIENSKKDLTLKQALEKSKQSAKKGYRLANKRLSNLSEELENLTQPILYLIEQSNRKNAKNDLVVKDLTNQLNKIIANLNNVQIEIVRTVQEKKELLDEYSVTLFGRTKTGKSTLMEILTKGDGSSIGKGAQRTTTDVRDYDWKGLKVTDVPGIAAFGGEDDEKLAYQSANLSDVIIFLISDDAPQSVEAQSFAKVRSIGRPIIGICNVKKAVEDEADIKLFLRSSKKLYDKRIRDLLKQFSKQVRDYTSSRFVTFTVTHLHSKFLAEQNTYEEYSYQLEKASQFEKVENRIVDEIKTNGVFYRQKVFIDLIAKPYIDFQKQLLEFSAQNSSNARIYIDKQRKFRTWSNKFKELGQDRIKVFVSKEMESLREYVPGFAEDYYDNKKAGEYWNEHIKESGIEDRIKLLQNDLQDECSQKMISLTKELHNEVQFVTSALNSKNIKMDKIIDTKKGVRWASAIIGTIGVIILASNPAGWLVLAAKGAFVLAGLLGLGTFFQSSKEEKKQKAQKKLSDQLNKYISRFESQINKKLNRWFKKYLVQDQIYGLNKDLGFLIDATFKIADTQRELAWKLNDEISELNESLLKTALKLVNGSHEMKKIKKLARVPGNAWMLMIDTQTLFSNKVKSQLQDLLNESIWFVKDTNDKKSIVSQAIGREVSVNDVSIEEKLKVAHVIIGDVELTTYMRINLAQQLTGLHIMKH